MESERASEIQREGWASMPVSTRERCLRAGCVYLCQSNTNEYNLKVIRLTELSGHTTGAFFHTWKTEQNYKDELLQILINEALQKLAHLDRASDALAVAKEIFWKSDELLAISKFMVGTLPGSHYSDKIEAFMADIQTLLLPYLSPEQEVELWGGLFIRYITGNAP